VPEIQAAGGAVWGAAAAVQAVGGAAWADGASLQSIGSPYTPPPPPSGATVVTPGSLAPLTEILPAATYTSDLAVTVRNLRIEGAEGAIEATRGSINIEDGSALWRLSCEVPRAAYDVMRAGEQPPLVGVQLAGREWAFVVDGMDAPRAFVEDTVRLEGLSLAALADAPYELAQNWINDAPSSAAQIAALAQTFTGLDVSWRAPDWDIPAGNWSFNGSPWGAVLSVAAPISAVVEADPAALAVVVSPRYPVMPNAWATTPPDVQVPAAAVLSETVRAMHQPPYTGVYVAGAAATVAAVRLAGTSGAEQAPMVVSELLTDLPGQVERARTILAQSGAAEMVSRTLQVLDGPGQPGVIMRGQLVRWVDPEATWTGMVRSTRVDWSFGDVLQTVGCERRLAFPVGSFVPGPKPAPPPPSVVGFGKQPALPGPATVPEHNAGDLLIFFELMPPAGLGPPEFPVHAGHTEVMYVFQEFLGRFRISWKRGAGGPASPWTSPSGSHLIVWVAAWRGASVGAHVVSAPNLVGLTGAVPDLAVSGPSSVVMSGVCTNRGSTFPTSVPDGLELRVDNQVPNIGGGRFAVWTAGPGEDLMGASTSWGENGYYRTWAIEIVPAP
jgi:hypothetical protein